MNRMRSSAGRASAEDGFTLIELLVVVIIIGILAAIGIPAFLSQRERADVAALQSDLRNLSVQAEGYYHRNDTYNNFEASDAFLTFERSPNVVLTLDPADSQGDSYCIEAASNAEVWSIRTNPTLGAASLAEGAC